MSNEVTNPALKVAEVSGSALTDLAKEFYFRDVKVEIHRNNFLNQLQNRIVVDKRNEGFHCCHCSKISKKDMAFTQNNRVIFPKNNDSEIWLVNSHYDGCRGWD